MSQTEKRMFPRPDRMRENWLNLNGEWEFALFQHGREAEEARFALSRDDYQARIRVPFSWASPLSGIQDSQPGIGWYRKTTRFTAARRVFLCFGAVDYLCDLYVNGQYTGHHQGGYAPFEFDITEFWLNGDNRIEVRAEDQRLESQTYGKQGYGEIQGIWQTVWLEERPESYIRSFDIITKCSGEITMRIQAHSPDGVFVAASFAGEEARAAVQNGEATLTFRVAAPRLWSPENPYLYEGTITLADDCVSTYFGIREIEAMRAPGHEFSWIYFNKKPIYINAALDQAFHPEGYFTYPSDEAAKLEVWRVKRLGLNAARVHIKAEEPVKLYWMDKLGVMVIADMPCFWGEPDAAARDAYEAEWPDIMARDRNHPAIIQWVMFNESWGILTRQNGEKTYLPSTQAWVHDVYRRAKQSDPTRLVEDNSPCRYDHIETDVNTWHFYANGYEEVKKIVSDTVRQTYPGSTFNYLPGYTQNGAPLMNSECGAVWGVDDSAGDSDIAWHYHYMLNEFRLHDKLCGFVFTELNDVVNEFNGYYRLDGADKDFGYEDFCPSMTLRDLHTADFVALDNPPCTTAVAGKRYLVNPVLSSFSDEYHASGLTLAWTLWHDGLQGRVEDESGSLEIPGFGYGTTRLESIGLDMPMCNALAVFSCRLMTAEGRVISRNFTTFDVRAALPQSQCEIPVAAGICAGFSPVWTALGGEKLCMGKDGSVTYTVSLPDAFPTNMLTLFFEAGAKRILKKDLHEIGDSESDLGFMRGYLVDRGAFENSYFMTDDTRFPSKVAVYINGEWIAEMMLENDWADSRGVLSWHAQPNPRKLDEAGSYGELKCIAIPSRMVFTIRQSRSFQLEFRVTGGGGLALYGRGAGRYPVGILLCGQ